MSDGPRTASSKGVGRSSSLGIRGACFLVRACSNAPSASRAEKDAIGEEADRCCLRAPGLRDSSRTDVQRRARVAWRGRTAMDGLRRCRNASPGRGGRKSRMPIGSTVLHRVLADAKCQDDRAMCSVNSASGLETDIRVEYGIDRAIEVADDIGLPSSLHSGGGALPGVCPRPVRHSAYKPFEIVGQ